LGAVAIFVYVGAEVAIGSLLVSYMKEAAGFTESDGAQHLSYYWGGAMIGRFAGAAALRRYWPAQVLLLNASAAAFLVLLSLMTPAHLAVWLLLGVGLCNSIMFPTIFTLAIAGLGSRTEQGSGILCTAIVGGAIIPAVQGALADRLGLVPSFLTPAICYAYVAWYAVQCLRREQIASDLEKLDANRSVAS
jgi:FHS family L-fucose permease-like MFS transporter